jgi:hypothetical protein
VGAGRVRLDKEIRRLPMKYEQEYIPDVTEMEDVVHVLKDGRSETLAVPDDDGDPEDEEEPHADYD